MRVIKVLIFIFLLTFSVHAFGKSNDYYKQTLVHVLTECNSDCQRLIFVEEINVAVFELMDAIVRQLSFELSQKKKRIYD